MSRWTIPSAWPVSSFRRWGVPQARGPRDSRCRGRPRTGLRSVPRFSLFNRCDRSRPAGRTPHREERPVHLLAVLVERDDVPRGAACSRSAPHARTAACAAPRARARTASSSPRPSGTARSASRACGPGRSRPSRPARLRRVMMYLPNATGDRALICAFRCCAARTGTPRGPPGPSPDVHTTPTSAYGVRTRQSHEPGTTLRANTRSGWSRVPARGSTPRRSR